MFQVARNDYRISPYGKSRGIALLVMLALILVSLTVVAINRLSINSSELKQKEATLKALATAREAIMGYALTRTAGVRPPGTLPCPDTDNDGRQNISAGVCTSANRRGLVPYIDLAIPQPLDGTGAPLWYAVANNYAGDLATGRNSSLSSTLRLDGQSVVFIVIAAQSPTLNQQPRTSPLAPITEFLEGDNADATLDSYTNLQDDTHNDLLLGMPVIDFWQSVEKLVLAEVSSSIKNYRTNCGVYPWASTFTTSGANSVASNYEGGAPLGAALPTNWGVGCAPQLAAWLVHWKDNLYYAICKQATPVNPPTTSCLGLVNAAGVTTTAQVIAIAPGAKLAGQNRPPLAINNFFEGKDATPNDNQFDNITPTATDNDLMLLIAP